jgi:SAM-dependent methyltransferase
MAHREAGRKLDIGCGRRKRPGHIGLDHSPGSDADVVADLARGLPFPEGIFQEVWMSHVFEHVAEPLALTEDILRVCAEGAFVEIRGPHFSSPHLVWGDPTHHRELTLATFVYFAGRSDWYVTRVRFEIHKAHLVKGDTHFRNLKLKIWYWPFVIWNKVWE